MEIAESCENCKFWLVFQNQEFDGGDVYGDCRMLQPVIMDYKQNNYVNRGVWPVTLSTEWCGKFKSKKESGDN